MTTFGRKPLEKLSGVKSWNVYRIDLDTNVSEFYRTINTNDEGILKSFCKRFNSLMARGDFQTAYTYRENKNAVVARS